MVFYWRACKRFDAHQVESARMIQEPQLSAVKLRLISALAGVAAVWYGASSAVAGIAADVLIQGGTVYSGAESPASHADVVIVGDKIVYVGPDGAKRYDAKTVVDARGKIVAPGFIDVHTHPDTYIRSADAKQRLNAPWLFQGVATIFMGVDGYGTPEVAQERARFERQGVGDRKSVV